jgi:hypothetical protein
MSVCLPSLSSHFYYTIAAVTLHRIVETLSLDNIVAFDTVLAFVIPLVALLTSLPVMWCKNAVGMFVYSKEYTFPILFLR